MLESLDTRIEFVLSIGLVGFVIDVIKFKNILIKFIIYI